MTRRCAIYYFSGTGNTEHLVDLLAAEMSTRAYQVDTVKIEEVQRGRLPISVDEYALIGIAHPVLGFDCPGLVYAFLESLPAARKPVFIMKSAGDYHAINYGSSKRAIRLLTNKGYDVFHDTLIPMPCNWLLSYDDRLNRALVEAAAHRVKALAASLLAGERKELPCGPIARRLLRGIGILEDRYGARYFGKYLRAGKTCTYCGNCIKHCPSGNIAEVDGKIVFGGRCMWCMRCIYACPSKAIDNKYMNLFILKGGYRLRRIQALPYEAIDFSAKKLGMWYKYFRGYFQGT
ncbi:MAG: EFR1 family ferrodoxin [Spirochaetes bacterium]|nr:EFR1 family ferrodoxin [Spirochaetota bacterium]